VLDLTSAAEIATVLPHASPTPHPRAASLFPSSFAKAVKVAQEKTRQELYAQLGMSKNQWREYRQTLVDFRNQMAAHHDLNAAIEKYPDFDVALKAGASSYCSSCTPVSSPSKRHAGDLPGSITATCPCPLQASQASRCTAAQRRRSIRSGRLA
jgi:hypothetical protein